MTGVRIEYRGHWPEAVQAIVAPQIDASLWLLPPWIWELWVFYQGTNIQAPAQIETNVEYGTAQLEIGAVFLDLTPEARSRGIRHELLHTVIGPLADCLSDSARIIGADNDALAEQMREQRRRGTEQVACALEWIVTRRLAEERS